MWQAFQAPSLFTNLVMRTRGDPMAAVTAVKDALRQVDPDQGAAEIVSMEQLVAASIAGPRLQTVLLGALGALGLLLACIGVYGVTSYPVARRVREMGIRIALGAAPSSIRALVLREGMALAVAGVAVGVPAALGLKDQPGRLRRGERTPGGSGRGRMLVPRGPCHRRRPLDRAARGVVLWPANSVLL